MWATVFAYLRVTSWRCWFRRGPGRAEAYLPVSGRLCRFGRSAGAWQPRPRRSVRQSVGFFW